MGYGAHMDKLYFEVKSYFRYKKTVVPDWVNPPLNSLFFLQEVGWIWKSSEKKGKLLLMVQKSGQPIAVGSLSHVLDIF